VKSGNASDGHIWKGMVTKDEYFPRVMKMPAKLVQELLGHDDIEPTPGVQICKMQRAMMDRFDEMFGPDV
jgi:hypothetical protein